MPRAKNGKTGLTRSDHIDFRLLRWVPGTINRVENRFLEVLENGYALNNIPPSSRFEPALSLDMADSYGIVQFAAGHDEELLECDSYAYLDPAFGGCYIGELLIFKKTLSKRLRSADYLSDEDIESIMTMIQPDRNTRFCRRIYANLYRSPNEQINFWPEVLDFLSRKNIKLPENSDYVSYLISAFLSIAIGIYQMEKINKYQSGELTLADILYYKPRATLCDVEHYYGVRAVGIEDGYIKPLDILASEIVEPKDIGYFTLLNGTLDVNGSKYTKKDLPKLIYPEKLHAALGL